MGKGAFKLVIGVGEERFQVGVRGRHTVNEVLEYEVKSGL